MEELQTVEPTAPQAGPLPAGAGKKKRRWPRRLAVVLVLAAAALHWVGIYTQIY